MAYQSWSGMATVAPTPPAPTVVFSPQTRQPSFVVRAVWFVFVGWWLGALWLTVAWLISLLVITLPISIWMYNRTSGVITLQRH
ncbi:MAG: hypothetical protein C4346_16415 [Chloroflexota bacterium]